MVEVMPSHSEPPLVSRMPFLVPTYVTALDGFLQTYLYIARASLLNAGASIRKNLGPRQRYGAQYTFSWKARKRGHCENSWDSAQHFKYTSPVQTN